MTDFERNLRDRLRRSEQELDTETLQTLKQARLRALAGRRSLFSLPRKILLPLGGMTLASLALVIALGPMHLMTDPASQNVATESADVQDLDFYYWLSETQDIGGS